MKKKKQIKLLKREVEALKYKVWRLENPEEAKKADKVFEMFSNEWSKQKATTKDNFIESICHPQQIIFDNPLSVKPLGKTEPAEYKKGL